MQKSLFGFSGSFGFGIHTYSLTT